MPAGPNRIARGRCHQGRSLTSPIPRRFTRPQPGGPLGDRSKWKDHVMPLATPETYSAMLERAKEGGFAYPAINVTSSTSINAALRGFAEAGSDGIIQASTGGAEHAAGTKVKDMVTGAIALAEFTKVVADKYDITVALHTDHCPKDKLDTYVKPLIAAELRELTNAANIILEIEVGVVGGEEDGVVAEINDKLYTSPEDFLDTL